MRQSHRVVATAVEEVFEEYLVSVFLLVLVRISVAVIIARAEGKSGFGIIFCWSIVDSKFNETMTYNCVPESDKGG